MLSKRISLHAFEYSDIAERLGFSNKLPPHMRIKAEALCTEVLDPVIVHFGPIQLLHGYRCKELNTLIGGDHRSQHMLGEAVDFIVPGVPSAKVCNWMIRNLPQFDQIVLEGSWVHVSYLAGKNRMRKLSCQFTGNRNRVYEEGIV